MKDLRIIAILSLAITTLIFTNCSNEDISIAEGKGHVNIHLTDSPFPIEIISSTTVTIDKIEIRKKMINEISDDTDTFIVLSNELMMINLLDLTNGITEQIAASDLEVSYYDMIRLHVVDAKIMMNDGSEFTLKVPSGSQSGIKVKIDPIVYLAEGQPYDVLPDFDVSRSFILKGNLNNIVGFNFKPVVRGVFLGAAGRIEGNVSDTSGVALENAMVKAWPSEEEDDSLKSVSDDEIHIVSSFTDQNGNYKLIGLPEGKYTVISALEGFKNDTIMDVFVVTGKSTSLNFKLEEIIEQKVATN